MAGEEITIEIKNFSKWVIFVSGLVLSFVVTLKYFPFNFVPVFIIFLSFFFIKQKKWVLLSFLITVLFLELGVTLNSPIAFGDEGYHVTVARWMGTNIEYPQYTPLHGSALQPERFNRLPMWNLTEAAFYMLLGFNDLIIKFLMPFLSLMTGVLVYTFVKKIYSEDVALISSIITVSIPSFVTYSLVFYTTVPFVFFFSFALLSFLYLIKSSDRRFWILTGLFSGFAILTNVAGLFLPILFVLAGFFVTVKRRNLPAIIYSTRRYGTLVLIILVIISTWLIRNVVTYPNSGCSNIQQILFGSCPTEQSYTSTYSFAGRTAEVGTETGIIQMGLVPYIKFAYGFYSSDVYVNAIGVGFIPFTFLAGIFILLMRRNNFDLVLVSSVLIFFMLFYQVGGLFSGRAEDTARYFLNAVPLVAIVAGNYFGYVADLVSKYRNVVFVVAVLFVMFASFTSMAQKTETMKDVKRFSPTFFEICNWVKNTLPQDATLFSLHTYPTMYNCERKAVWETPDKADIVLSNNKTLVGQRLKENGINYIFVQKFSLSNTPYGQTYPISFVQFLENNNDSFEKVKEWGTALDACISQGGCDGGIIYRLRA